MYVKDIPSTHLDLEKNWNNIMYSYTCPYACTTCEKKPHKLLIIFSEFGLIKAVRLDH